MAVARFEAVAVIEDDQVAVAAFGRGLRDGAVSGRVDLAAWIGRDVETLMEILVAGDRIRTTADA